MAETLRIISALAFRNAAAPSMRIHQTSERMLLMLAGKQVPNEGVHVGFESVSVGITVIEYGVSRPPIAGQEISPAMIEGCLNSGFAKYSRRWVSGLILQLSVFHFGR